jgi:hypothetical protein
VIVTAGLLGLLTTTVKFAQADLFSKLPPEKQALADREAAQMATARALGVEKPKDIGNPYADAKPAPIQPLVPGIVEEKQAPFATSQVHVQNSWQGIVNGQELAVFAGVFHDSSKGLVTVVTRVNGHWHDINGYYTPAEAGAVRVTAEIGGKLTLQSENGTTFTFDIASRTFVAN